MKTRIFAATMAWCAVTMAETQSAPAGRDQQPAAGSPSASTKETHPILLLRPDQADQYRHRVAGIPDDRKTSDLTTDVLLRPVIDYLRGRRNDDSVEYIRRALASKHPGKIVEAVLIYDLQQPFLTREERALFRQQFLSWVEPIYEASINTKAWWFSRRAVNNWTYGYAGKAIQNMLFIGLAFPDHPRSALYVARAVEAVGMSIESANPGRARFLMPTSCRR
jgi:hypothetical protein